VGSDTGGLPAPLPSQVRHTPRFEILYSTPLVAVCPAGHRLAGARRSASSTYPANDGARVLHSEVDRESAIAVIDRPRSLPESKQAEGDGARRAAGHPVAPTASGCPAPIST
jgi:hypothetical protein